MSPKPKLYFIYNARKGLLQGVFDSAHKLISPKTYPCDLCALTYHSFGKRPAWENYLQKVREDFDIHFLYKSEKADWPFKSNVKLPAILLISGNKQSVILAKSDFKELSSLESLIEELDTKLEPIRQEAAENASHLKNPKEELERS